MLLALECIGDCSNHLGVVKYCDAMQAFLFAPWADSDVDLVYFCERLSPGHSLAIAKFETVSSRFRSRIDIGCRRGLGRQGDDQGA